MTDEVHFTYTVPPEVDQIFEELTIELSGHISQSTTQEFESVHGNVTVASPGDSDGSADVSLELEDSPVSPGKESEGSSCRGPPLRRGTLA